MTKRCPDCEGCGRLANTEAREPWSMWLDLPLKSSAAFLCRAVKPIECPTCKGTGEVRVQP